MSILIHPDPVPLRVDERGDVRVGQSRVLLDTIVSHFVEGMYPDEIAGNYPTISRSEVYAVLAYYLRHQAELDGYRQREPGRRAAPALEAAKEGRWPAPGKDGCDADSEERSRCCPC